MFSPKTFCQNKFFGPKNILPQKQFGAKQCWPKTHFGPKKIFQAKNILGPKEISGQKKFDKKKCEPKFFLAQQNFCKKKFCPKKCLVPKNFGQKNLAQNNFLAKKKIYADRGCVHVLAWLDLAGEGQGVVGQEVLQDFVALLRHLVWVPGAGVVRLLVLPLYGLHVNLKKKHLLVCGKASE